MTANSLQDFLEQHLKDAQNITPELIAGLKTQWRKNYVTRYNKKYREDKIQITFRLSKQQYTTLVHIAHKIQLKPTVFCRHRIIEAINGSHATDMKPLKLLLLELTDHIEASAYEHEPLNVETLMPIIEQMQELMK